LSTLQSDRRSEPILIVFVFNYSGILCFVFQSMITYSHLDGGLCPSVYCVILELTNISTPPDC